MKIIKVKSAGYSDEDELSVDVGIGYCRNIVDGVSFKHDNGGWWLISFNDLKTIYERAVECRHELDDD